MNTDRKNQYQIPVAPAAPGEVIKTYDLSGTLTAEEALGIALAAAGETQAFEENAVDRNRNERFGAATVSTVEAPAASSRPIDLGPKALGDIGAQVTAMRKWELAV